LGGFGDIDRILTRLKDKQDVQFKRLNPGALYFHDYSPWFFSTKGMITTLKPVLTEQVRWPEPITDVL